MKQPAMAPALTACLTLRGCGRASEAPAVSAGEMGAPEHQVICGGHSADQRLTALSLIKCDALGNYLLLTSFNEQGKVRYLYDCVAGEPLPDETGSA